MAAEQSGADTPEKANGPKPSYFKLKARESLGEDAKGTSSWSFLKELKISLVDGGVSILKQGISKLTGAFSGADLPEGGSPVTSATPAEAPASANTGMQSQGAIAPTG